MEERTRPLTVIEWTNRASRDLTEIERFISRDSPGAAHRLIDNILARIEILRLFPDSGRRVPEFPDRPFREILFGNYRIFYRSSVNGIQVLLLFERHRQLREEDLPNA